MKKLLFGSLLMAGLANADPLAERGWYYYEDPQIITTPVESPPKALYPNWTAYNDAVKKEFEEIQDRAIYNSTPDNVQAYNQALRTITNNAVRFGMLTVTQNWQDPKSGIANAAPNGAGLQMDLDNQRKQIGDVVRRYAIFYFVGNNCKYCNVEANELKRLEYTYKITVRVISLDGATVPQYPTPTADKGISKKLGVTAPGELLAFDSTNNKTTVLGYGYIHFDQIIQRLQTLFITGTADWDNYLKQQEPVVIDK